MTVVAAGPLHRLARVVLNLAVLTGLAGLAWWGHHTGWTFADHPDAPQAEPDRGLARVRRATDGRLWIEFDSAEAAERAGVDITPVWRAAMTEEIEAGGEVLFDPALVARLSPRVPGTAWRVTRTVGDTVRAGEVLALLDAAEVGRAKADFQQALVQVRLRRQALADLATGGAAVPERQRSEAEAAGKEAEVRLLAAGQALANLGLPVRPGEYENQPLEEVVRGMRSLGLGSDDRSVATANLVPIRAPFDGVVLTADVVPGEVVEAGKVVFVVVDPRRLVLTLHVRAADALRVAPGHLVKFTPDGSKEEFTGRVAGVGAAADETTRTVPVRAEMANDHGRLRASTLGKGHVVLRTEPKALTVPTEAVRTFRGEEVVFVRHAHYLRPGGPRSFEARSVRIGARDGRQAEIVSGLQLGDVVATKGSGVLLGELQRGPDRESVP